MKNISRFLVLSFAMGIVGASSAFASSLPTKVTGPDVLGAASVTADASTKMGMVVVFLSAVCPCSDSHLKELKALTADYPDFTFVGVHSNTDEAQKPTTEYFKSAALPFSVIHDHDAHLADQFKAFKTPHAFVILKDGTVAYQGGVSSSRKFEKADEKYLREALADVAAHRPVRRSEGRTLGCAIARGEKSDW